MSAGYAKHWCFTVNNPGDDEERFLYKLERLVTDRVLAYAVAGREVGESGTPHLQGFISLTAKKRFSWIKAQVHSTAHWEVARGTPQQAADYCKKDENYVEYGDLPVSRQGQRNDLASVREILDTGGDLLAVAEADFGVYLRYERSLRSYMSMRTPKRDWVCEVRVFWGDAGTGKTRRVHELEESNDLWVAVDNQLQWFDGYEGQPAVLFDDFVSVRNEKFGFLLQLLDRYAMRVPIKGGFVNWCPRRIYFTSNIPVEQWHNGVSTNQFAALRRRITQQVHFTNLGINAQEAPRADEEAH